MSLESLKEIVENTTFSIYAKEIDIGESIHIKTILKQHQEGHSPQKNKTLIIMGELYEDLPKKRYYKGVKVEFSMFLSSAKKTLAVAIKEFMVLHKISFEEAVSIPLVLSYTRESKRISTITLTLS